MSNENDTEYYVTRERQARDLAASSSDPQIQRSHLDMAERYAKLREELEAPRQR